MAPAPAPTAPREFRLGQPAQPPSLLAPRRRPPPRFRHQVIQTSRAAYAARLVTPADLDASLGLIVEASRWLKALGKDQWAEPWPDREQRDARTSSGLANKKTVIVRQGDTPVATVTMANPGTTPRSG